MRERSPSMGCALALLPLGLKVGNTLRSRSGLWFMDNSSANPVAQQLWEDIDNFRNRQVAYWLKPSLF